jgi:hypothetical protein
MKRYLSLIILILVTVLTHAQNTFEHVFISHHNVMDEEASYKSLELSNGDYVTMGCNRGCEFCSKDYYIRKYDHQGNLIFEKSIIIGSGGDYADLIQTKDGNLLFYYGYGFATVNLTWDYRLYFYKMDLNGDTLFTKNYYLERPDQNGIFQIQLNELADSSIIFSCNAMVMKLNQNLDSFKTIAPSEQIYRLVKWDNDSNIAMQYTHQLQGVDTLLEVLYSSNLDSIRQMFVNTNNYIDYFGYGWWLSLGTEVSNSNYVSVAGHTSSNIDTLAFISYDSLLTILWSTELVFQNPIYSFRDWVIDSNTVTFWGTKYDIVNYTNDSALYYRLNIRTGDSLQFKVFSAQNIYQGTHLRDFKYCSEGYLISGQARADTTGWKSYFAVLDTLGNVTTFVEEARSFPMQVYSNPTRNSFYIEVPNEKSYEFLLIDGKGKILERKTNSGKTGFDLEKYAAGNYFVTVLGDHVKRQVVVVKQ